MPSINICLSSDCTELTADGEVYCATCDRTAITFPSVASETLIKKVSEAFSLTERDFALLALECGAQANLDARELETIRGMLARAAERTEAQRAARAARTAAEVRGSLRDMFPSDCADRD